MKRILCFGDSNTWGYRPDKPGVRYNADSRWTGVLAAELGKDYEVIEEGLNGRTTIWDDPFDEYKNGKHYLVPCLETHREFDLITLMLGTNDLKAYFNLSAASITEGIGSLIKIISQTPCGTGGVPPKILLIAPPPIGKLSAFEGMFEGGLAKSKKFKKYYKTLSESKKCYFLDAGKIVKSSDIDGIHWEPKEHKKFAVDMSKKIKEIFNCDELV